MNAQLATHSWPKGAGEALASDKYEVYVALGAGPEQKLDVLMSNAIPEGDFQAKELTGRTFSFASVDYNSSGGSLSFRVVKKFGGASAAAEIVPRSYALAPKLTGGKEVRFSIDSNSRYLSVNFRGADNETSTHRWIRHMLCIFVDPPETDRPNRAEPGVLVYTREATMAAMSAATILYFPAGYHNLRAHVSGAPIEDGILQLRSGQSVYLESGTFVDGLIAPASASEPRQKLYGRGILSGRLFPWFKRPGPKGPEYRQIVRLGNNSTVEGVTIIDSPSHGIVSGGRTSIAHIKLIGWHCNNDAIRVGSGSEIKHSFIRAVDDHFYNFNIWVHDCVLWPGHNGAILTYGWGGLPGDNAYNAGSSLLENIDIIHPEWIGLGNNNGLVAAQTGLDYRPFGYGGDTLTVLRNIRVEGSIPGLVNLKPRSSGEGIMSAIRVPIDRLGYLGDLLLDNITVDHQFAKGRIKGARHATTTGDATFFSQNIRFSNLRIGGLQVTSANAADFFDIEARTTREITFSSAPSMPGHATHQGGQ